MEDVDVWREAYRRDQPRQIVPPSWQELQNKECWRAITNKSHQQLMDESTPRLLFGGPSFPRPIHPDLKAHYPVGAFHVEAFIDSGILLLTCSECRKNETVWTRELQGREPSLGLMIFPTSAVNCKKTSKTSNSNRRN